MTICTCGCPQDHHVGGFCLSLLECLCSGWTDVEACLDRLSAEPLTEEQIDAALARLLQDGVAPQRLWPGHVVLCQDQSIAEAEQTYAVLQGRALGSRTRWEEERWLLRGHRN